VSNKFHPEFSRALSIKTRENASVLICIYACLTHPSGCSSYIILIDDSDRIEKQQRFANAINQETDLFPQED
jgi:hypothetical protein